MPSLRLPADLKGAPHATVRRWLAAPGGAVAAGQALVELETAEALVQVQAPAAGILASVAAPAGTTLKPGEILGEFTASGASAPTATATATPAPVAAPRPTASGKAATPILMPQAGNTMEEGRIVSWKVKAGDAVKAGQILCEIETDKSTIEFESPVAGTIGALLVEAGGVQKVKLPIACLSDGQMPVAGAECGVRSAECAAPAAAAAAAAAAAPAAGPAATPILMPQAGNTMEEGRIVSWKVKAGDVVKAGQILCEIETDKSTIEFESPVAGTIGALLVEVGGVQKVKLPIACLNDGVPPSTAAAAPVAPAAAAAPAPVPTAAPRPAPVAAPAPAPVRPSGARVPASPAARRLAGEKGVDLAAVAGSGPGGRVLSTDVAQARPGKAAAPAKAPTIPRPTGPVGEPVTRAISKMRKAIATNLQQSKQTVPHFYVKVSVDAGPLLAFSKAQKAATGCSVNDVVLAGLARAMSAFPAMRSRWNNDSIIELPTANIGIAVGMDDGLVVPVLMQVDRLSLAELAAESKRVVDAARKGKLENLGRASMTVSNLGMFGVEEFSAIINPPEAGILAVSAAREEVIVKDGALRPGRVMTLTLSADHRVVDGLLAAQFVKALKEVLENPEQLA